MEPKHTGEAVVALGEAFTELSKAVRHDAEDTFENVRSITVGQMTDSVIRVASSVFNGAAWIVKCLAFNKMEAPASAQASG